MRTDSEIKKDAEDELRWDPDIDATDAPPGPGPSARKRNGRPGRLPALRQWRTKLPSALESWTNGVRADRRHQRQ